MTTYTYQVTGEPYAYVVGDDAQARAIEDVVRTWVMRGAGLDTARVLWRDQTGARPLDGLPWASVRLGGFHPVAAFDEVQELTDATRTPGTEIELRVIAARELPVSVQFFGPAVVGAGTPLELALATQAALALPSVREALDVVGLSPYDNGTIQNIAALNGTAFEGRALLEVRFYVTSSISEFTGYIDSVTTRDFMGAPEEGTQGEIDI